MRRMGLSLFAMAAVAVASNSAFAGHTAAEVLMFLGDGVVNPDGTELPSFAAGSNPSVDALAGDTVAFPVYIQAMVGDQTPQISGYAYDTYASNEGLVESAGVSLVPFGTGTSSAGSYDGSTAGPPGLTRLTANTFEQIGGATEVIGVADGAVHVGWLNLAVGAGAVDGDAIDLYMAVGANGFGLVAPGTITVAFGWDDVGGHSFSGGLNSYRLQNPAVDVIGTSAGHVSTLADASINIIPDPATMGLLGLGLLAIRRRRA